MKPVEKLGRGIANVAFGPLELLMKGWDVTQEQGGIAGVTYGPLKGVCYVIAREVVGVVDIVTFPFPLPDCPDDPPDSAPDTARSCVRPTWSTSSTMRSTSCTTRIRSFRRATEFRGTGIVFQMCPHRIVTGADVLIADHNYFD